MFLVTSDNIFSWPVGFWFVAGVAFVASTWRVTVRVKIMWQRVFIRAGVISLCFTPVPSPGAFAMMDPVGIVPVWSVLLLSIAHAWLPGLAFAFIPWLIITYLLWVGGMSIHHLF